MKSYVVEGTVEAVGNSEVMKDGTSYKNVKIGNKIVENFLVGGNASLFFHVGDSGKYYIVEKEGKLSVLYGVSKNGEVLVDDSQKVKSLLGKVTFTKSGLLTCFCVLPMILFIGMQSALMISVTLVVWAFLVYRIRQDSSKAVKAMDELPVSV
ncbi:hypothetical protein [Thalassospira australica]|uniref:hypothetical protein n=1 Tax=Thalassospira australica TaxID=1528106 RepID=UPI0012E0A9BB|nr:hypothetical protein [Thalassospira australica]